VFSAIAGLIGVAVTIWTAPSTARTTALVLLFGGALFLAFGVGIPEILRYLRAPLPSGKQLIGITARYSIEQARSDEIAWIAQLEASVYSSDDAIPERLLREWYVANPTGFSIVKSGDGTPIGHLDILPLRPQTLEPFLKGDIVEREIRGDSLYSARNRQLIKHLYVESIILRPPRPLSNAAAIVAVLSNVSSIIARVADLSTVERVYAIAATTSGEGLMKDLGFELHGAKERRKDGHNLFVAEVPVLARKIVALCGSKVEGDTLKALAEGV